jgi:hypothetical protein
LRADLAIPPEQNEAATPKEETTQWCNIGKRCVIVYHMFLLLTKLAIRYKIGIAHWCKSSCAAIVAVVNGGQT